MRTSGNTDGSPGLRSVAKPAPTAPVPGIGLRRKKPMVLATSWPSAASASPGFWKWTMYISSPSRLRMISIGSTGERAENGVLTPMTPAVRSGWRSAICQTTKPPQSWPQNTALSIFRWSSSRRTRSPVKCSMSYASTASGRDVRP